MSYGTTTGGSGGGTGLIDTITGNSGGAVGPDGAFDIDFLGDNTQGVNIVGNPGANTLTASGIDATSSQKGVASFNSEDFTVASGAVSLKNQQKVRYVGKHGSDTNDGFSIQSAYLTFGAAITASSAGDCIVCLDGGTYTENLTAATQVNIYAPNSILSGNHVLANDITWRFGSVVSVGASPIFDLNTASAVARIEVDKMANGPGATCFRSLQGTILARCQIITVSGSYMVDIGTLGEVYIDALNVVSSVNTTILSGAGSAKVGLNVSRLDSTAGTQTVFGNSAGTPEFYLVASAAVSGVQSNITASATAYINAAAQSFSSGDIGAGKAKRISCDGINNVSIGGVYPEDGTFDELVLDGNATTYTGSENVWKQDVVQTINATLTPIVQIPVSTNRMISVEARINGLRSTFAEAIGATVFFVVRRDAGNVTLVGTPVINIDEDVAGTDVTATVDVASQEARINVQGIAAQTWNWVASYNYHFTITNA